MHVTSLGHQVAKRFLRGTQIFKRPIVVNYVQHIFPGGQKIFQGGFANPDYGPGGRQQHTVGGLRTSWMMLLLLFQRS